MERKVTLIAMLTGAFVALLLPSFFFIAGYQSQRLVLQTEIDIFSTSVTQMVNANPELWTLEDIRIEEVLRRNSDADYFETRSVYDDEGSLVAEISNEPHPPTITARASIYDAGESTGMIQITRSIQPLVINTFFVGILGSLIAYLIYFSLKIFPLRALNRAIREKTIFEKQRADAMEAAKLAAEMGSNEKSLFLSRMSHELRTPLNAIIGFGQLLEMDNEKLNDVQKDYIKESLNAGHHLLELVNDVLDLAKIETGKFEVSIEAVDLDEILKSVNSLISIQAHNTNVQLIDHISDKGYTVYADLARLKQVLLNILSNAVKYSREKSSITLDSDVIDKQLLRISITDTGLGMTEEDLAKLFKPFERLDIANNVDGTGVGLVISKYLIELMGGSIGVESVKGEGSTFWVEIPLAEEV